MTFYGKLGLATKALKQSSFTDFGANYSVRYPTLHEGTTGTKEGKCNSIGLFIMKNEYGSEIIARAKEGRWNHVGLEVFASLSVNATRKERIVME